MMLISPLMVVVFSRSLICSGTAQAPGVLVFPLVLDAADVIAHSLEDTRSCEPRVAAIFIVVIERLGQVAEHFPRIVAPVAVAVGETFLAFHLGLDAASAPLKGVQHLWTRAIVSITQVRHYLTVYPVFEAKFSRFCYGKPVNTGGLLWKPVCRAIIII